MKQKLTKRTADLLQTVLDDKHSLVLFDGNCASCDFMVNLILKKDSCRQFLFTPLQSSWGTLVSEAIGLNQNDLTTLILIHKQEAYTHSSAVFEILQLLGPPFNSLLVFSIFPLTFTDLLYSLYAKNRYKILGPLKTCRIYSPEEKKQFLKELS